MYDAWAAHDDLAFGSRLGDMVRRPPADRTEAARREAASFAAHRALADLFPSEAAGFAKLMGELGYDHGDGANRLGDLGRGPGQPAEPYADWTGYRPVYDPMRLVDPKPLAAAATPDGAGQRLLVPLGPGGALHAGDRLGAAAAGAAAPPRARLPGPGRRAPGRQRRADRRAQGHRRVLGRRPQHRDPPGHWCVLAPGGVGQGRPRPGRGRAAVLRPHRGTAGRRHRLLGRQAGYDSVRPVTAIRFLFAGQEVLAWGGPGRGRGASAARTGSRTSPPRRSPSTPSGHSTFSAAAAAVLARFTGSDRFGASVTIPAGSSRVEPGTTPAADVVLSWPTFTDAADLFAGRPRRRRCAA
jgi:hypothetical protein